MVTGALMAMPGGAGIVVSNLSTAYKLNDMGIEELARNYTAAQILDINRSILFEMGVGRRACRAVPRQPQLHADRHGRAGGRA